MNLNTLKILQWNVISLNSTKLLDLTSWLSTNNADIVCLQETNLNGLKKIIIPGFIIYRKDRSSDRKGGGVAVLVKNNLSHSSVPSKPYNHDVDVVGVILH